MKKILASVMALVMVATLTVSVFAAGAFLSSPTNNHTTLEDYSFSDNCGAELILTPYGDRDQLDDATRKTLEEAYDSIASNSDLSKIVEGLKEYAESKSVDPSAVKVSDLFNLSYKGCDDHGNHTYTAKMKPEYVKNFVGVMQYVDGKWILIKDVRIENGYLIMTSSYYGPTAILVSGGSPVTGDAFPWIYVVLMVVSAAGLATVVVLSKKRTA